MRLKSTLPSLRNIYLAQKFANTVTTYMTFDLANAYNDEWRFSAELGQIQDNFRINMTDLVSTENEPYKTTGKKFRLRSAILRTAVFIPLKTKTSILFLNFSLNNAISCLQTKSITLIFVTRNHET